MLEIVILIYVFVCFLRDTRKIFKNIIKYITKERNSVRRVLSNKNFKEVKV